MQPDPILPFFAKYIYDQLGIVYAEHNYFQLRNRLEEIAKLLGASGVEELHSRAQRSIDGQFKQLLLDIATNNETSFFRDPKVFQAIRSTLLDSRISAKVSTPLRIWSAASSSGQEALSVSIMIKEWSEQNKVPIDFKITATDISSRILEKARKAEYSQLEIQRGLSAPLMVKYFTKTDRDTWVAKKDITQHIQYATQNLKEKYSFPQSFDLVLCRNVLIYQNVQGKSEILKRISDVLVPGGFLVLGTAEGLLGLSQDFVSIPKDGTVIYQTKSQQKKAA